MTTATFATHRARFGLAVLVGSLLAGSLAVAQAQTTQDEPAVVVKYADLDLSTTAGVTALYKRIANAARMVCPYQDARELTLQAIGNACREASIARAVRSVHNAELAALQNAHAKRG
jgi:UrcA family protein